MPIFSSFCRLIILVGIVQIPIFAQVSDSDIHAQAISALPTSLESFREFLQIPNMSQDTAHMQANLTWAQNRLNALGFTTQVLVSKGIPHLYASAKENPKLKTVLVYMQLDGQPVDPAQWHQENPFVPVLKRPVKNGFETIPWDSLAGKIDPEWRIFARSASDSKGPAMVFFTALEVMQRSGWQPGVNLKFILDFQEELSSPQLPQVIRENRSLFEADGILIMDGTRHVSNLPNLTFGARGIATVTLTVFGAKRNLHSGQYGNFAPNPVFALARLLAAMKGEDGRVLIPGFYEGVQLTAADYRAMQKVPESSAAIQDQLGIAKAEGVGSSYQEALQYPSLNIRGIQSAWVGDEVRTLIPAEAVVELDMRTVQETPGERQVALLREFVLDQGFHLIAGNEPSDEERKRYPKLASFQYRIGSQAFRSPMDSDFGAWLEKGMQKIFGENFVKTRQTGGSQPMAPFINLLAIPAVSVRVPNPDNNIHAPNENIRLGNYLEGIQTVLGILTEEF